MKLHRMLIASAAIILLGPACGQGQYYATYYHPVTTYSQPTIVGYAPPATTYRVAAAPATTYTYALTPAPTTVYYTPAPTTVYYTAAQPVTSYYRPLVGQGITRVGYSTPVVTYRPVVSTYRTYYPWW
jgi:hypothetical protein